MPYHLDHNAMNLIKSIWNGSVWSKVIAAIILCLGTSLLVAIASTFTTDSIPTLLQNFWTYKFTLQIWELFILIFVVWIIWSFIIPTTKKTLKDTAVSDTRSFLLFDLNKSDAFSFQLGQAKNWKENKEVGETGLGKLKIENGLININRDNKDGRVILTILQYHNYDDPKVISYIRGNVHLDSNRLIRVNFKAKVIGGYHDVRVYCRKYNDTQWVHRANDTHRINNTRWEEFTSNLIIPSHQDFTIHFEDFNIENAPSSIQIKELTVGEVSH
jgi:hypothetical protein